MGTNFYARGSKDHIGKRSGAGLYCWDCRCTLHRDGEANVHRTRRCGSPLDPVDTSDWYKACPNCGKAPRKEGWDSAIGRELGFATKKPDKKTGVASCSSFSWAMSQDDLKKVLKSRRVYPVEDEYGRKYTRAAFRKVLAECPIQFHTWVGREFS